MRAVSATVRTHSFTLDGRGAARGRTSRTSLHLEIVTDAAIGRGEAAPLPGLSRDSLDDARAALDAFAAQLPLEVASIGAALTIARGAASSSPAARFAIETALLDALARAYGTSIAALLVAGPFDEIARAAVVDTVEEAMRARRAGARCLKIKVGGSGDLDRVRAIVGAGSERKSDATIDGIDSGRSLSLRLDANQTWPASTVLERLSAVADLPIEFIEEPCANAVDLLAAETDPLPVPIALDESLVDLDDAAIDRALCSPSLAALVLKPTLLGGFARCLELAARARAAGKHAIVTHALESEVGFAACVQLARVIGGDLAHGLWPFDSSQADNASAHVGTARRSDDGWTAVSTSRHDGRPSSPDKPPIPASDLAPAVQHVDTASARAPIGTTFRATAVQHVDTASAHVGTARRSDDGWTAVSTSRHDGRPSSPDKPTMPASDLALAVQDADTAPAHAPIENTVRATAVQHVDTASAHVGTARRSDDGWTAVSTSRHDGRPSNADQQATVARDPAPAVQHADNATAHDAPTGSDKHLTGDAVRTSRDGQAMDAHPNPVLTTRDELATTPHPDAVRTARAGVAAMVARPDKATVEAVRRAWSRRQPLALLHHALPTDELARRRRAVDAATTYATTDDAVGIPASGSTDDAHGIVLPGGAIGMAAQTAIDDDVAFILFTSGSTGDARGVVLTRDAIEAAAAASAAHLGWRDDDRWFVALSLAHAGGLAAVMRCELAGKPIALLEGDWDRAQAAALLEQCTLASLVPTQLADLLADPSWRPPRTLRAVLLGGAAASPALLVQAAARRVPFLVTYGMTESFGQLATAPLARAGDPDAPLVPLPGVEIEAGTRAEPAPIIVRAPMLAARYLDGAPIAPQFQTADLGFVDGALHVVGRADDVIVTGGENVHPVTVESVLAATPGVRAACAFGVPDERWGQIVGAAIAAERIDDAALASWHAALPAHARPRQVAIVDELPVLATGKLDRRAAARLPRKPVRY